MPDQTVLTAADPEPPAGTVVRDDTGCRWVRQPGRVPCGWISEHDVHAVDPESWRKVAGNYGPVTVLSTLQQPAKSRADLAQQIRERLDIQELIIKGADDGVPRPLEEADQWKAALLAVLDVHKPEGYAVGGKVLYTCAHCRDTGWGGPDVDWPCATAEAIAAALGIAIHDSRIEDTDG